MTVDYLVIGAGIAGASVAAELVDHGSVLVLEAEDHPGYHTTGRSASFWHESYGGPKVQPLTTASKPALDAGGFLSPRGSLYVAEAGNVPLLDKWERDFAGHNLDYRRLDHAGMDELAPGIKPAFVSGIAEVSCQDIDVAGLHGSYLGRITRGGGAIRTAARVERLRYDNGRWSAETRDESFAGRVLINAAGAWADNIAILAGLAPLGIQPMRRTLAQVRVGCDVPENLPLVIDIAGSFYFKPSGPNQLWLSPHDETPSVPCDAAPEELDVAIAIDRFEQVMDWPIRGVERKWAGLRSFAPDRLPVYGRDPRNEHFFWCAGQGGFGIQTAPAAGIGCAAMLRGETPPVSMTDFLPDRLMP